jgi:hypothetical protein
MICTFFHSEKLQMALAARERAEKKQQEYEDRLRSMQEEMERSQVGIITLRKATTEKRTFFSLYSRL